MRQNKGATNKTRRFVLLAAIVFLLVVVAVAIFQILTKGGDIDVLEKTAVIKNYSDYVYNLPKSERIKIEQVLYQSLLTNNDEPTANSAQDIYVRENTYSQDLDVSVYKTVFIVDIDSIKQSYQIIDYYSKIGEQLGDYTIMALCVPEEYVKYDDFVCRDRMSAESSYSNPISSHLPIIGPGQSYEIYGADGVGDQYGLNIVFYTLEAKELAVQEIQRLGFDPQSYQITYQDRTDQFTEIKLAL